MLEGRSDPAVESPKLGAIEACRSAERVEACPPQSLVDVDVSHPGERPLVEKRGLERDAPAGEALTEPRGREEGIERFVPDAGAHVRLCLSGLEQQPRAEAPDVPVCDIRVVV